MADGSTTWTYTYDANGMRTSRSDGTTTYKYVYNGDSLVQMTVGSDVLYFTSDTVTYNSTTYYYVTNLQGDIVAILNSSGNAVVEYTYDAWGNILSTTGTLSTTLGAINPLRYRGYVYDEETGLYYLQSRYYDPEIGRFLNADSYTSTGQGVLGNDMFTYCLNNPVCLGDFDGRDAVVLYKEDGVGHIGLLVEDENGDWWHFYWGADGGWAVAGSLLGWNVKVKTWCVEYTGNPRSLKEINESGQYAGTYVNDFYLDGDFSDVIDELKNPSGSYNLYNNNCGQVSLRILAKAETAFSKLLANASKLWTPKEINYYLEDNIQSYRTPRPAVGTYISDIACVQ